MNTYKQLLDTYILRLQSLYDLAEITSIYHLALKKISNKSALQFKLNAHDPLATELNNQLLDILPELEQGRPIQYIFGEAEFYGLTFIVNEHVLIPRGETEELVDLIIKKHQQTPNPVICDVGTGSGCIPIALAKHLVEARITTVDISPEAIATAKENAKRHQVDIDFRQLDILEWDLVFNEERFDIIVSNPPYIRELEKNEMHQNVLLHEPALALFVDDHNPLIFYSSIADFARRHLNPNGQIYFEINQYLSEETKDMMLKKGFCAVEVLQDINNVPRILTAQLRP